MNESAAQSDWDFYFCNVNDVLSSIMVNLEVNRRAPDVHKQWLLWFSVQMQLPRDDGLSSDEEAPTLHEIEDVLTGSLSKLDAELVGRITGGESREFYFYAPTSEGLDAAIEAVRQAFPAYVVESGTQHDPGWSQYGNVLYPSETDLQRIMNRRVIDELGERGDDHSIPRPVDHMVYFRSPADRKEFAEAAVSAGFAVSSEGETDDADRRYSLNVVRTDPATLDHINEVVLQLIDLAEQWNADYDGWGCEVQTATFHA